MPAGSQQLDQHRHGGDDEADAHELREAPHRWRIPRDRSARWDVRAAWAVTGVGAAYEFSADQTAKAPRGGAS